MKFILSFLSVLLYYSGFWICKYIHPKAFGYNFIQIEVDKFTDLRYSIYAIIFGLIFIRLKIIASSISKFENFILCIGLGIVLSDLIDRFYFNITEYTKEDKIMLIITIIISYLETYKKHIFKNIIYKIFKNKKK